MLERQQFPMDTWISEALVPSFSQFGYGTPSPLMTTGLGPAPAEIAGSLPNYAMALRSCPPAFAAQMKRALVLSQARFRFRNTYLSGTPGRVFGNRDLRILERPWPNATTGRLLSYMEWHAGLAGNAYVTFQPKRLRILRPDWVAIVHGSQREPDDPAWALDAEVIGYAYQNRGSLGVYTDAPWEVLLPSEVAHWAPVPDPESPSLGMSWITPALREIQADRAATDHKLKFFRNGATPNLVVKGLVAASPEQFEQIVEKLESRHTGLGNAYRTLYLSGGADATVVGSNLQQLDFKSTQGAGETRISTLSMVPAPILGIAEGMQGSALNAGNFGMSRRLWADTWIYPTLQDMAGALAPLVTVPGDAELWPDARDMPILREDAKDAAEIDQIKANTLVALINGGIDPRSAIQEIWPDSGLKHTGLVSVQLQPPGSMAPAAPPANMPKMPATQPNGSGG
jgi:phage portal protein BeeE